MYSNDSGRKGSTETAQDLVLEALDVDLAELRFAVAGDQLVQGDHGHRQHRVPADPSKAGIGRHLLDPAPGEAGDGRGAGAQVQGAHPTRGRHATRLEEDAGIATVEQAEDGQQVRLRFDRDDAGAEPAEHPDAVADVRSQVEGQIAGAEELPVEPGQPTPPPERSVVDRQRAAHPEHPTGGGRHRHRPSRRSLRHRRSGSDSHGSVVERLETERDGDPVVPTMQHQAAVRARAPAATRAPSSEPITAAGAPRSSSAPVGRAGLPDLQPHHDISEDPGRHSRSAKRCHRGRPRTASARRRRCRRAAARTDVGRAGASASASGARLETTEVGPPTVGVRAQLVHDHDPVSGRESPPTRPAWARGG